MIDIYDIVLFLLAVAGFYLGMYSIYRMMLPGMEARRLCELRDQRIKEASDREALKQLLREVLEERR